MQIQMIELSKLARSPRNVRKTGGGDVTELAASIRSVGLLQNLSVIPNGKKGRFEVVDGARRLAALTILHSEGALPATLADGIPCDVRTVDTATEASLAANVVRVAMTPADQFDAFALLAEEGKSDADIAAAFGVSERTVQQRLKLTRVSPRLFQLYREEMLNLEQLCALAISDNHAAQEAAWYDASHWDRTPSALRRRLSADGVLLSDRRVLFVTTEAFENAGGFVCRDLFDTRNGGYVTDAILLDKLVSEKLEASAAPLQKEGWLWVTLCAEIEDADVRNSYGHAAAASRVPTKAETKALKKLEADAAKLEEAAKEFQDLDEMTDEQAEAIDAIETRQNEVNAEIRDIQKDCVEWTNDIRKVAGAVLGLDHNGNIKIVRGLIHPDQRAEAKATLGDSAPDAASRAVTAAPKPVRTLSDALVQRLSAQRTLALRATLASNPAVALVTAVHALALTALYQTSRSTALDLSMGTNSHRLNGTDATLETSASALALAQTHKAWTKRLPKSPEKLFAWLQKQEQDTLLNLLAVCIAAAINVTQLSESAAISRIGNSLRAADELASAVDLNMAEWWKADAASYLSHVPKAKVLEALTEAGLSTEAKRLTAAKKDVLHAEAERLLAPTGWLPAYLR